MDLGRIAFLVVFFIAYTIQAITGFAGNMLAMPAGIALIGFHDAVLVLNFAGVLGCGIVAVAGWKHIDFREFFKMIAVMTVFLFIGIWLDSVLPMGFILTIYGVIILAVGLKYLIFPTHNDLPEPLLWVVLAVAGLIQGMFVSGGAFLVIYAIQKLKDKDAFRATLSLIWTVLNGIYAVVAFFSGQFEQGSLIIIAISIPLILIATALGTFLQKRMSRGFFLKLTYILLVGIGVIQIGMSVWTYYL